MLTLSNKIFVWKLILSKKLEITRDERKELTRGDVYKLRKICKFAKNLYRYYLPTIKWSLLKKLSYGQIRKLCIYTFYDFAQLYSFLEKGYNIKSFIEEIVEVYKDEYSEYIRRMIKRGYTIKQIKFLVEHKMLYSEYNLEFNYCTLFEQYTKLGFDPTNEAVINCSSVFLETIKKFYPINKCYLLIKAQKRSFLSQKSFLEEMILLYSKGFSAEEIFVVYSLAGHILLCDLQDFFSDPKKTKEDFLESLYKK